MAHHCCLSMLADVNRGQAHHHSISMEAGHIKTKSKHDLIRDIVKEEHLDADDDDNALIVFNLYNALAHLTKFDGGGLIDMQWSICQTHFIAMQGLLNASDNSGGPGHFSRSLRYTVGGGGGDRVHVYPYSSDWCGTMQTVVDRFNDMVVVLNETYKRESCEHTIMGAQILAWFAYNLLTYHPFSDGNGRVTRLLVGYLSTQLFGSDAWWSLGSNDDLVKALVSDRMRQQHEEDYKDERRQSIDVAQTTTMTVPAEEMTRLILYSADNIVHI